MGVWYARHIESGDRYFTTDRAAYTTVGLKLSDRYFVAPMAGSSDRDVYTVNDGEDRIEVNGMTIANGHEGWNLFDGSERWGPVDTEPDQETLTGVTLEELFEEDA
jgi:hypothetical protein